MRTSQILLIAAIVACTLASDADAQSRRDAGRRHVYVTAESRYGGASITAPVRESARGRLEVRLPGGTWIECRRSCSDTLRRETVDFWKERGHPNSGGDGPGYFNFKF